MRLWARHWQPVPFSEPVSEAYMNPLMMAYADDAHERAEQYAGTTAAYVVGRRTCTSDVWQRVRDRGSESWLYEISQERPNNRISDTDELVYMGGSANTPLWPYLDANGQQRTQNDYSKLTDIRVGSPYVTYYVDHVATIIRSRRWSGLFMDGHGARLWGTSGWTTWPADERAEWTAGSIDLARRLDEMRRAEDPSFMIVGNNHWDTAPQAEQYVDGVVSELHAVTNLAMVRICGKPSYSPLGQRRVFAISRTKADAEAWAKVPGVTHVACTADNVAAGNKPYSYPTTPVVRYSAIQRPSVDVTALQARLAQTETERDAARAERDAANAGLNAALADLATARAARDAVEIEYQAAARALNDGRAAARSLFEFAQS
jgi:hypothetical protein